MLNSRPFHKLRKSNGSSKLYRLKSFININKSKGKNSDFSNFWNFTNNLKSALNSDFIQLKILKNTFLRHHTHF